MKDQYFVSLAMHIYHSLCLVAYQYSAAYQYSTSLSLCLGACEYSIFDYFVSLLFSPSEYSTCEYLFLLLVYVTCICYMYMSYLYVYMLYTENVSNEWFTIQNSL